MFKLLSENKEVGSLPKHEGTFGWSPEEFVKG